MGDDLVAEMASAGLAGACHFILVAGARFERWLTVVRVPLLVDPCTGLEARVHVI